MSTFTPNLQYEQVARNADVGTWDTPTNNNWALSDLVVGGIATIPVNNSNIVLSAAQFQCRNLTFNSTLTGSITVTLSASFTKSYEIRNLATGSSAFTITLGTTGGGSVIACPPGQTVDVFNDGINIGFKNLPPVGSYMDFAVSTVPLWISGCTVPPWVNCNGGTFSAATYPALAVYLGGTTLPDCRGTVSAALDQSTNRLSNFGPPAIFAVIGDQNLQSHTHTNSVGTESAQHVHEMGGVAFNVGLGTAVAASGGSFVAPSGPVAIGPNTFPESATHNHTVTINNAGSGAGQNLPPTTIVGLRMIRGG